MKQILIALIFLPQIYLTQTNPTVSGKIISQESSTPIAYATVSIGRKNADNNLLNQTLSQENGIFTVSSPARGAVEISVWAVGYDSLKIDLFIGEKNDVFDVGTIVLKEKEITLDAVEIQADKSTISSDLNQKSFNLDDNISQSGGSVLDALKGYPGVTVDQEGKVYLRGSDKIMVLIDGVLTPLTGFGNQKGLDNIPASSIARIEIINNPSAKFQASGMAGVINLIPKTNLDKGWNGEIGLSLGMGQLFRRKADLPTELGSYAGNHKILPNLNLNYRNENIRYFLNGSVLNQRKLPNNEFTTRTYNDGRVIASQVPENRTQTQYIVNTGLDWNVNSKNILSLSSILDYESHIDTAQIPYILTNTNIRNRYWHWKEDEVTGFFNVRLDYKHLFPKAGHELAIRGQYTRGWENEQYFLSDSSQYREANDRTHIIAKEHTSLFNLDYTRPLKSGRLETGAMFQLRTLPVTYEIGRGAQSVIAEGLGEWSDWGETILSAYANYLYERPKFDVEAGLRAEQVWIYYDIDPANTYYPQNDAYDYQQLYPNIRLTFNLADQHKLSAFYNRRVDRPGEPNLRIFPKYDDPELLKVGNPYLRPQFTQNFELAYRHSRQKSSFYLAGYYRLIQSPFLRIYSIDESTTGFDIINKIYQNVGSGTNLGTEIILTLTPVNPWKITGSLNVFQNTIHAYTGTLLFPYEREFTVEETTETTLDAKLDQAFTLNGFELQLTTLYLAPRNTPQGRILGRSSVNLGIQKPILNGKGKLTLSASDIFNQYGIREEIQTDSFSAEYENLYETQVIRLTFSYKF